MRERRDETIGWYGAVFVVMAYGLVSLGLVRLDSLGFHILNLLGGVGLGWWSWRLEFVRGAVLCGVWVLFAIYGLVWIV